MPIGRQSRVLRRPPSTVTAGSNSSEPSSCRWASSVMDASPATVIVDDAAVPTKGTPMRRAVSSSGHSRVLS